MLREEKPRSGRGSIASAVVVQHVVMMRLASGTCPGTRRHAWRNNHLHQDELSVRSLDVHSRPRRRDVLEMIVIEGPCGRRPTPPRGNN